MPSNAYAVTWHRPDGTSVVQLFDNAADAAMWRRLGERRGYRVTTEINRRPRRIRRNSTVVVITSGGHRPERRNPMARKHRRSGTRNRLANGRFRKGHGKIRRSR